MSADSERFAALIADAQRYTTPVDGLHQTVRDCLDAEGQIIAYDEEGDGLVQPPEVVAWVDGAVADEQTDALIWAAAVAVAQTGRAEPIRRSAHVVMPVCGDRERFRGIAMAVCELEAATAAAEECLLVMVDGGLSTGLMQATSESFLRDPDVIAAVDRLHTERDTIATLVEYIELVNHGTIVGLPKQDSSQHYTQAWSSAYAPQLGAEGVAALRRLRDRPFIDRILKPGEMLLPRPAQLKMEAAGARNDPGTDRVRGFDVALAEARGNGELSVAYFKPAKGAQRTIRIEYAPPDSLHSGDWGASLAQQLEAQFQSPRIVEPLGQHLVDRECKRLVQTELRILTAELTRGLASDPTATRHYRS